MYMTSSCIYRLKAHTDSGEMKGPRVYLSMDGLDGWTQDAAGQPDESQYNWIVNHWGLKIVTQKTHAEINPFKLK